MITLYHGGGAGDFEILSPCLVTHKWEQIKHAAVRLLETRHLTESAEILKIVPFELSEGMNGFGDDFLVLHAKVPTEEYVIYADAVSDPLRAKVFASIANALGDVGYWPRFIAVSMDVNESLAIVSSPTPQFTTATVDRALMDAQNLILTSGAISAVDRVHTAFHGYLKEVCDESAIGYSSDPSVADLFNLIRNNHPKFTNLGPHDPSVLAVLRASAKIIDAVNTLRNQASVAHPNLTLLGEPEAVLIINATRTLLHYLDSKLK